MGAFPSARAEGISALMKLLVVGWIINLREEPPAIAIFTILPMLGAYPYELSVP